MQQTGAPSQEDAAPARGAPPRAAGAEPAKPLPPLEVQAPSDQLALSDPRVYLRLPLLAAQASWSGFPVPFAGTLGWLLVVVMSDDSGDAPWAPLAAAVLGWPVALLCDLLLLLPALLLGGPKLLLSVARLVMGWRNPEEGDASEAAGLAGDGAALSPAPAGRDTGPAR